LPLFLEDLGDLPLSLDRDRVSLAASPPDEDADDFARSLLDAADAAAES